MKFKKNTICVFLVTFNLTAMEFKGKQKALCLKKEFESGALHHQRVHEKLLGISPNSKEKKQSARKKEISYCYQCDKSKAKKVEGLAVHLSQHFKGKEKKCFLSTCPYSFKIFKDYVYHLSQEHKHFTICYNLLLPYSSSMEAEISSQSLEQNDIAKTGMSNLFSKQNNLAPVPKPISQSIFLIEYHRGD